MSRISGVLFTLTLLLCSLPSLAQKDYTLEADQIFQAEHYNAAVDAYKKAYPKEAKKSEKGRILFQIGESYRMMIDNKQAEQWYRKAEAGEYTQPDLWVGLGDVLQKQGKYDDAIEYYKKAAASATGDMKLRADNGVEACEKAVKWEKNPGRYVVRPEVQLNTKYFDFAAIFADKKYESIIFTSSRPGGAGNEIDNIYGEGFSDLYTSERDNKGKWSTPQPLPEIINSPSNEGAAFLDDKFGNMYFTRCKYEKKEPHGCQIYMTRRQGQNWAEPELLDFGVDDTTTVGHPVALDDDLILFASDLRGGQGGKDLWYIRYEKKTKLWGPPVNLGPDINTPGDEMYPYVRYNGDLYFASNGHVGMGGMDIFTAEKKGELKWGKPQNLGAPINSSSDDFAIVYEDEFDRGFFTSNRSDSKGGDDIYSFMMPPLIFKLEGTVTDVDSKEPLEQATVKLVGTDGSSAETKTDPTGHYSFETMESGDRYINENTSYTIEVSGRDLPNGHSYLNSKGQETTVGLKESTAFVHDFALQCSDCGEIKFPLVLYALGKWDLMVNDSVNSKDSLDYLYTTLTENPTIVIELAAHTDSRGNDKANQVLSQKRAQTCVTYLIEQGIDPERMVPVGYGETQLLVKDEYINSLPTKQEQEAAHQKNRRTVFRVLRDDFVPEETEEEQGNN